MRPWWQSGQTAPGSPVAPSEGLRPRSTAFPWTWDSVACPSTTSLDSPGAEMGNLVGRDEPEHDVLEKPQQHLAMDGREGPALPRGGKSPPGRRASSAGPP